MQWHHNVSIMEAIESTSSGETRGVRVFEGKLPCEAQSLTKTTREREMTSEASLASMARSMTNSVGNAAQQGKKKPRETAPPTDAERRDNLPERRCGVSSKKLSRSCKLWRPA